MTTVGERSRAPVGRSAGSCRWRTPSSRGGADLRSASGPARRSTALDQLVEPAEVEQPDVAEVGHDDLAGQRPLGSSRRQLPTVMARPTVSTMCGNVAAAPSPNGWATSTASTGPSPSAAITSIGRLSSTPPSTCSRLPTRCGGTMPGSRTDSATASAIGPRRCTTCSAATRSTLTVNSGDALLLDHGRRRTPAAGSRPAGPADQPVPRPGDVPERPSGPPARAGRSRPCRPGRRRARRARR